AAGPGVVPDRLARALVRLPRRAVPAGHAALGRDPVRILHPAADAVEAADGEEADVEHLEIAVPARVEPVRNAAAEELPGPVDLLLPDAADGGVVDRIDQAADDEAAVDVALDRIDRGAERQVVGRPGVAVPGRDAPSVDPADRVEAAT